MPPPSLPLHQDANQATRFALAARITLSDFFHADGDGLPQDLIDELTQTHFDPVLSFIKMSTSELIDTFYRRGAEDQCKHFEDPDILLLPKSPEERRLPALGALEIELGYKRQTDEGELRIVRGIDLPIGNTYINLRLQSGQDARPFKYRSTHTHQTLSPRFNESILIPEVSDGVAVQIRIQTRTRLKMDKVVGEVLLGVRHLKKFNGQVVRMRLKPLKYPGQLGWMQFGVQVGGWEG